MKALLEELGLRGWPKTSGSRGMHVNVRIEPRWTFTEVRRAALAFSREIERRAPDARDVEVVEGGAHGVFLDYNQNAKDRTTCSAYSVRPLPDARVSAPLALGRGPRLRAGGLHGAHDADAVRGRSAIRTRGWTMRAGSLEQLLELAARDEAAGLGDAPWPPHFRKMEGEAPRVAPSRAKGRRARRRSRRKKTAAVEDAAHRRREFAEQGGRARGPRAVEGEVTPKAAEHLAVDDVLVDSMRGRSSTWTRIRVNLRNVPGGDPSAAGDARPGRRSDARVARSARERQLTVRRVQSG